jgi:hypothetical protein
LRCVCPKGFKVSDSGKECIDNTNVAEDHCHEECFKGECIDQRMVDPKFVGVKEGKGIFVCMFCNSGWIQDPNDPS